MFLLQNIRNKERNDYFCIKKNKKTVVTENMHKTDKSFWVHNIDFLLGITMKRLFGEPTLKQAT